MTIVMTRKDLIAKLNEKLALARAEDLFKAISWLPEAMREKQTICD